ncbi:uncharacterized protein LOC142318121 [Lycorma delicatula]|uniref:uncharacterized protein LOC142318121 n=1 Tax=Lycorma delicatula TaxID=130591 RepID=UPI003F50E2EE
MSIYMIMPLDARLLIILVMAISLPNGVIPRPQYDSDEDVDISKVHQPKYSLEELRPIDAARVYLNNKQLHSAVMSVLYQLSEEDLRALEELVPPEELLQGDMPPEDAPVPLEDLNVTLASLNSSETELPFPELQKANRESSDIDQVERNKELRLNSIKTQILSYLGLLGREPVVNSTTPNSHQREVMREMYENMKKLPQWPPSDIYTEKVQSFYPSCELPRNTDEELWSHSEPMHLLFNLNYPTSLQGTAVNIVAAKLRLYKFSQGNVTVAISETCPPSPPVLEETVKKHPFHFPTNPAAAITVDDKMVRVSIYWYTRSLKKHRVKRKLLDSQMISVYGEEWTEWNVRGAVKAWRESNRNFGLAVVVEDEDGNLLPAHKYFSAMNCSKEASTARPIPGFLIDAATLLAMENNNNQTETQASTFNFNSLLFPMIDLCTVELPESDIAEAVFYHNARYAIEQHLANASKDPQNVTVHDTQVENENETEKHHIRHQSHHHQITVNQANQGSATNIDDAISRSRQPQQHIETIRQDTGDSIEEITWADDIDGHQLRKHIIVQKVIKKASKDHQDDNEW